MSVGDTTEQKLLSLREAFEAEQARVEADRRAREEVERRRQEADLAAAEALHAAMLADPGFLQGRGLVADRRRFVVTLDHERFRISAYFENGVVAVTQSDKRSDPAGATVPRRQENVDSPRDALRVIAQFLVEETC
jgi:hypothetical protein